MTSISDAYARLDAASDACSLAAMQANRVFLSLLSEIAVCRLSRANGEPLAVGACAIVAHLAAVTAALVESEARGAEREVAFQALEVAQREEMSA